MGAPYRTLKGWRKVFWICTIVIVTTNILFNFLVRGDILYWNDPNFRRRKYDFGDDIRPAKWMKSKKKSAQKKDRKTKETVV